MSKAKITRLLTYCKQYRQLCKTHGLEQNETHLNKFQQITQVAKLAQKALMNIQAQNNELSLSEQIAQNVQNVGDLYASDPIVSTDDAMNMVAQGQAEQEELLFPFTTTISANFTFEVKEFRLSVQNEDRCQIMSGDVVSEGELVYQVDENYGEDVNGYHNFDVVKDDYNPLQRVVKLTISARGHNEEYSKKDIEVIKPMLYAGYELNVEVRWMAEKKPKASDPDVAEHMSKKYQNLMNRCTSELLGILEDNEYNTTATQLTTAYATAHNLHKEAVQKSKEAEALRNAMIASLFSVVGGTFISAIGNTDKVISLIKGCSKHFTKKGVTYAVNVFEDFAQMSEDKLLTTGDSPSKIRDLDLQDPLVFHAELMELTKTIVADAIGIVKKYYDFLLCKKESLDRIDQANKQIEDLDREWDIFLYAYTGFCKMQDAIQGVMTNKWVVPSSITENIEIGIWAKWIKCNVDVYTQVGVPNPGGVASYEKVDTNYYIGWSIVNRLEVLGINKKLGIDFGSFESWTDEIKTLHSWAVAYKEKPLL